MIPKDEIKRKDFSLELPRMILKLTAISEAQCTENESRDPIDNDVMAGFGLYLEDTAKDLKIINDALYGSDETATEKTDTE